MELLNLLRNEPKITDFFRPECEDEGICIEVDNDIEEDNILIIKTDDYYNSLNLEKTPPSTDCLIIQRCKNNTYKIYLIELKNVERAKLINKNNLREKFRTVLLDFINDKFRSIFNEFEFSKIELVLCAGKVTEEGTKNYDLKFLLALPPILFRGLRLGVNGYPPVPTIKSC